MSSYPTLRIGIELELLLSLRTQSTHVPEDLEAFAELLVNHYNRSPGAASYPRMYSDIDDMSICLPSTRASGVSRS